MHVCSARQRPQGLHASWRIIPTHGPMRNVIICSRHSARFHGRIHTAANEKGEGHGSCRLAIATGSRESGQVLRTAAVL